ncbi:MAG: peptide ABC transporter substrate-binding protein [Anaerolineae bacterium]|nr:peptide ABC transporter substrate-binding protein [Anaerolineae bacterium]
MVKRPIVLLGALMALGIVLEACVPSTPVTIVETVVVERIVEVEKTVEVIKEDTPTFEPEALVAQRTLVVCISEEPDTLYTYGGSRAAATHIQQAVYDGPIDNRNYAYQPVILKKLPSLNDGDAVINAVTVQAGDIVVDDAGDPFELDAGAIIRPAGCHSSDCAIEFTGEPIEMDQMVATFELLDGLVWSNGDPLIADDSVYGFELSADPDTPVVRFTVNRTSSYEATSNTQTVWTGLPGYIDQQYYTNFWHPFPRKLWQDELGYSAADLIDAEESSRMPVGWGPFVITEWVAGDHITVEKNANYFRADEGLPYLDTVIFRFVPDPNAAVARLISGECDIATQDGSLDDQAELLLKLEQEGVVKPVFATAAIWEHVDFCINPAPDYDRPDFFEDVRVRHAIAMCLDRQNVVDTVLYGRSIVIDSYNPPEHPLYADGLTRWPYDPEAGMALLGEVGWVDSDDDGVREANGVEGIPDGTLLEFKWQSTKKPMREQYMQSFQQNLADCGVKVDLENLPTAEYYAEGPEGPLFSRRFDMGSFGWPTDVLSPCEYYLGSETPNEENSWVGANNTGFDYAPYNEQCMRAITALPGTEDYVEGHKEAQRIFSEQLPVIPLFMQLKLAAIRPEVKGFVMDPTEDSEMWNVETLDLDM